MPSRKAGQRLLKRVKEVLRETDPAGLVTGDNPDEYDDIACRLASLATREDADGLQRELTAVIRAYFGVAGSPRRAHAAEALIRDALLAFGRCPEP